MPEEEEDGPEPFEPDLSMKHQLIRMLLAGAAGLLVENVYTHIVRARQQRELGEVGEVTEIEPS